MNLYLADMKYSAFYYIDMKSFDALGFFRDRLSFLANLFDCRLLYTVLSVTVMQHHMIMIRCVCVIVTSQQLQQQPVATAPTAPPYTFSPPQTQLQKY